MVVKGGENTKSKKLIIILSILILLSISAVSASDNSTDDVLQASNQDRLGLNVGSFDTLRHEINNAHGSDYVLQCDYYNYTDNDAQLGIEYIDISKLGSFYLNGNGVTIDAQGRDVTIFQIRSSNVTLNSIYFVNASRAVFVTSNADNCVINNCKFYNNTITDDKGAAVLWSGQNGAIYNSNFYDNAVIGNDNNCNGSAVYWVSSNGRIENCNFMRNTARNGGAVYWKGSEGTVFKCTFENNSVINQGMAIAVSGEKFSIEQSNFINNNGTRAAVFIEKAAKNAYIYKCNFNHNKAIYDGYAGQIYAGATALEVNAPNAIIDHCTFLNNTAKDKVGGDKYCVGALKIGIRADYTNVSNCEFTNNSADIYAGAIEWLGYYGTLKNSNFINNTAGVAGAVTWDGFDGTVLDCLFMNNSAVKAGAINWKGDYGKLSKSRFYNNTASKGAAVLWGDDDLQNYDMGTTGTMSDSIFINNTASEGGAIYWFAERGVITDSNFTNDYASKNGGAIYWESYKGELTHSNFYNNSAKISGGAVYWTGSEGTVFNCNFTHNNVSVAGEVDSGGNKIDSTGAAIYNSGSDLNIVESVFDSNYGQMAGAVYTTAKVNIDHSTFSSNYANGTHSDYNYYGGAVYIADGVNSIIKRSIFNSNHAHWAGAVWDNGGNTLIDDCTFNSNFASLFGTIVSNGFNLRVNKCTFDSNTATNGGNGLGAGAIFINGTDSVVTESSFINNHANSGGVGGAIQSSKRDTGIYNCTFKSNLAQEGGAISSTGVNLIIFNATFESNFAYWYGGAIYSTASNAKISNCTFKLNNASSAVGFGGAIASSNTADNLNIFKCIFESNSIFTPFDPSEPSIDAWNYGGAISSDGDGLIVNNCTFTSNAASGEYDKDMLWSSGGAISIGGKNFIISNSSFTSNNATTHAGAIYFDGYKKDLNGNIFNCTFESNTANQGGAMYIQARSIDLDYLNFTGNNATIGSAIFMDEDTNNIKIANTKLGRNRANSSGIEIKVLGNTYAKANVTVEVYLIANDNIANAIWNNGDRTNLRLKNVSCEFSLDGNGRKYHTFNDDWDYPTDGFENSEKLWQSSINNAAEDAQLIDILIINNETGDVLYNITDGVLNESSKNIKGRLSAAFPSDDSDLWVTDADGKIAKDFIGLEKGTYDIVAKHKGDAYYTSVGNSVKFEISEFNVTKTTDDIDVFLGQNVTYNITVSNYGNKMVHSINLTDNFPKELQLIANYTTWLNGTHTDPNEVWKFDGDVWIINNSNHGESSYILPNESVVLTLVFKAIKTGTFNNTVTVQSNFINPVTATSRNTTVKNIKLLVNKTADVKYAANRSWVNYTITVKNVDGIDFSDVIIWDYSPDTLIYYEDPNDWGIIESNGASITPYDSMSIDKKANFKVSNISGDSYVSLWVRFQVLASEFGDITNVVNVTSKQGGEVSNNTTITVVPVNLNVNKTSNVTYVVNGSLVNYTIKVNLTGLAKVALVEVDDMLPGDLVFVDAKYYRDADPTGYIIYNGSGNYLVWLINGLDNKTTVELWVTARVNTTKMGDIPNIVSVLCTENPTFVYDAVNITVVPVVLNVNKTALVDVVGNNTQINFTVKVNLTGFVNVTNVIVNDTLPDGLVFDNAKYYYAPFDDNVKCRLDGNNVIWEIKKLDNVTTVDLWVTVNTKVFKPGNLTNNVTVYCNENTTKVSDNATVEVKLANLTVVKTPDANYIPLAVGEVNYTITVRNIGDVNATDLKVWDYNPQELIYTGESGVIESNGARIADEYDTHISKRRICISNITAGSYVSFWMKFNVMPQNLGFITNVVNVTCNENGDEITNSSTIEVVPTILNINKTANVTVIGNNSLVNYTIKVNNTGLANALLVFIDDILQEGLEFVNASYYNDPSAEIGCNVFNNEVHWYVPVMENNTVLDLWVVARTTGTKVGIINNNATVKSFVNYTDVASDVNITVVPVVLNVNKTALVDVVGNNTQVNFTVKVNLTSLINVTNVIVNDTLPDGLVFDNAKYYYAPFDDNVKCRLDGNNVIWEIKKLDNVTTVELWVTALTSVSKSENLTNNVTVYCNENTTGVFDNATVEVKLANLTVTKVADVKYATNISFVRYTITVRNVGDIDATDIIIWDYSPDSLKYYEGFYDWGIIESNGARITPYDSMSIDMKANFKVSNISAGSFVSLWVDFQVWTDKLGNITNVVNVTSKEGSEVSNNTTITVVPVKLNINKTANVTYIANSNLVNYTIKVNLTSLAKVNGVEVSDILPEDLEFVDAKYYNHPTANIKYTGFDNIVEWYIFSLDNVTTLEFWFTARVKTTKAGDIPNTVRVWCMENDTPVYDSVNITVVPVKLNLDKAANVTYVVNGSLVNYTFKVNLTGVVNATTVEILDNLPEGFEFVDAKYYNNPTENINFVKFSKSYFEWYIFKLDNETTVELWATVRVKVAEMGDVPNTARAWCIENRTFVYDSVNITVVPVVLNVNKTALVDVVGNNTQVNFTVKVNLTSFLNVTNVIVNDTLPDGLVFDNAKYYYAPFDDNVKFTLDGNNVIWEIKKLDNVTTIDLWVTALTSVSKSENLTNNVSVYCNENTTEVFDNAAVEVKLANLTVTKVADVKYAANTSWVNYTITVRNVGEIDASDVFIWDYSPANLIFHDNRYWGIIEDNGADIRYYQRDPMHFDGEANFRVSNISAGNFVSLWVEFQVLADKFGDITNIVNVTSKEGNEVSNNTTITVVPVKLNVNKTANVTYVINDSLVNYTIKVNLTSLAKVSAVFVSDMLPDDLVFVDAKYYMNRDPTDYIEYVGFNNYVEWIIKGLDNETTVELWVTARVNTTKMGDIPNTVSVSCSENFTYVVDTANITSVPVILTVNKTANATRVGNNTLVEFTIIVNNTSPVDATWVCVHDGLPDGFEFVSATEGYDKYYSQWNLEVLPAGESVTLTILARTNEIRNATNYVHTLCDENDTLVADSFKVDIVPVILTVNKTAEVKVVANDSEVTYRIVVNNTSLVNATDVTVVDVLPDELVYVTSTKSGNGVEFTTKDNKTLTWTIEKLTESIELFVTVKTTAFGNFTNNVTVTSRENDTEVKANETIEVVPADLTVIKTVNATNVSVGDLVEFIINVTNTGKINATNINVTDLLDSAFKVQTIGNQSYVIYNGDERIIWNIPSLDIGNSTILSVIVKLLKEGTFNNTASVKAQYGNETNSTVNVTAFRIPTHVSIENVTTYPDMNVTVEINVTSDDNKAFSGNVTVNFPDGSNQTVEIIDGNGNATWFVPGDYTPQVYNDTANYPGDDTFLPSTGNGTITVLSVPVTLNVGNVTGKAGQNVTILLNVTAGNGKLFDGNVIVTLPDGSNQTVEVVNGTGDVTWLIPEDYNGTYNYAVSYPGNETYLPSNGSGVIEVVPKVSTGIVVGNVSGYPDCDVVIPVNVTSDDGIPFNGEVVVTLPDGSNQTVEIINGTGNATWYVPGDSAPANYSYVAEFGGSEDYFPSNGTGMIEVLSVPIAVNVGNVTGKAGQNVTIPVNVTAGNDVPFNGEVIVTLPDGSNQTVEIINGSGDVTWLIPEDYNGTYNYAVSYPGNETYLPSNGSGVIEVVPKVSTGVVVGNVSGYPDGDVVIPVNVTSDDGNPVNGEVVITLPDGTNQTVEIVKGSGTAVWHVPSDLAPANYTYVADFGGNEDYFPSNGTGMIEVLSVPITITVGNVTADLDSDVVIPVDVTADNDVPFNGEVIVTLPDGSNQTVEIINGKGNATWHVPKDNVSQYNYTVIFPGNDKYLPNKVTGSISVILVDVELHIEVDKSVVKYGEVVEFIITVHNNGPDKATEVTVQNTIPKGFEYISDNSTDADYQKTKDLLRASSTTQSYDPSTGVWYIGDLANGEEAKLSILARANFIGTQQVNSSVSIAEVETDYTDNNDSVSVTVIKVAVDIVVGDVTAKPGEEVTIPIKVIPQDGSVFNGKVTVELPDGTRKIVEIIDGEGSVDWTVPEDYDGDYVVKVIFDGDNFYYPANGTGIIKVIPDKPSPEPPVHNKSSKVQSKVLVADKNATGNPIFALLLVLALLGINIKRRK